MSDGRETDSRFLDAAIRLGRLSLGEAHPNPAVGAIIVRDGRVLARGRTAIGGRPHAETIAIAKAGEWARDATIYVSLEPCAHHGRTPPCAEAIVAAGLSRAVVALADPDPRVSGNGIAILEGAGLAVASIETAEARAAHRGHVSRITRQRPFVTLKLAVSSDGAIGIAGRGQVAVTGEIARRHVHALRSRVDAILVGAGTLRADDPELTCRLPGLEHRSPLRLVLSASGDVPAGAKLFGAGPATWLLSPKAPAGALAAQMARRGDALRWIEIEPGAHAIPSALAALAREGITSLLVEGGARTAASFLDADAVDEALIFKSAAVLGPRGIPALAERPLSSITASEAFLRAARRRFGPDILTRYQRAA
ncbi:bifunctional diaminohydroxyphosphoribosylaminopyrimidine deaminase/5-amino-6-(5-phosphoribosylamino)uracil reductase RibD [Afifella sp. IM 167]|uniref:bifunctional diaminohydroxyphosphoribosylaminopyrimidine deaminase/5-amino-6-(5-phosphoribosylamino)uracil reductase RibD n=1 Tax=Afifella sp. IM 167 TaxID=2033586 RepID=UPI001CCBF5C3|nr:bifunctional diaminohydroxyphosphoribosylaminopyrimidine deaminase/5-amino-6-(5-phosphoribosylamino)uracil reductase RibD [Afifella sp. IM 167]MBZ8132596.1 riboflavin biosynthesis protein RibD [Afifella sp. IM 167]